VTINFFSKNGHFLFWQSFGNIFHRKNRKFISKKFEPFYETKYRNQPKNILKLFVTFAILSIAID